MFKALLHSTLISISILGVAWCQQVGPDDAFQVRYAANLPIGDSVVNMTNTGTSGGNICANLYAFDAAEELVSCCACTITPNALQSLSVRQSLISNTLTPAIPSTVVIKVLASAGPTCDAAAVTADTLVSGLRAWGTTIHQLPAPANTYGVTETPFLNAGLVAPELTHITSFCEFIHEIGGGYGICRGCSAGGLGAIPSL